MTLSFLSTFINTLSPPPIPGEKKGSCGGGVSTRSDIRRISLRLANRMVAQFHRHSLPVVGHKFSLGLWDGSELVGACIVGRPVARRLDGGGRLEVTRLVVKPGRKNACSKLYAAARREARKAGASIVQTYTLASESGSSLRGAGWKPVATVKAALWSRKGRPRRTKNAANRIRWEALT